MSRNPAGQPIQRASREMTARPLIADDEEEATEVPSSPNTVTEQQAFKAPEPPPPAATATGTTASAAPAASALALLRTPAEPKPAMSLRNRVGTRGAPYQRKRDGKMVVKLQTTILDATDQRIQAHAKNLPKHVTEGDFIDQILRDGLAKFEADLMAAAAADLKKSSKKK